jgi:hypothetical protein
MRKRLIDHSTRAIGYLQRYFDASQRQRVNDPGQIAHCNEVVSAECAFETAWFVWHHLYLRLSIRFAYTRYGGADIVEQFGNVDVAIHFALQIPAHTYPGAFVCACNVAAPRPPGSVTGDRAKSTRLAGHPLPCEVNELPRFPIREQTAGSTNPWIRSVSENDTPGESHLIVSNNRTNQSA